MSVFYRACDDCPARDSTVRVPGRGHVYMGGEGQGGRRSRKTSDFLDFRDQWPRTRQRIRESWQNKPHLEKRPFRRVPADSRSFGDAPWPAVKPCAANSRRALRGTSARGGGGHRGAVTAAFVAAAVLAACERLISGRRSSAQHTRRRLAEAATASTAHTSALWREPETRGAVPRVGLGHRCPCPALERERGRYGRGGSHPARPAPAPEPRQAHAASTGRCGSRRQHGRALRRALPNPNTASVVARTQCLA
jgi:hypothetical protein